MNSLVKPGTQIIQMPPPTHMPNTFDAPFDEEMERAFLGSILINPQMMVRVNLAANDFFLLRNQYVWEAILSIHKRDEPIERKTLRRELQDMGYYDVIGGDLYISELVNSTPSAMYAEHYAQLIRLDAIRRRALSASDEIRGLAVDRSLSVEEIVASVQEQAGILSNSLHDESMKTTKQLADEMFEALNREKIGVIATGIPRLNENMGGGMRRGNISVFGAETGTGKTWLAVNTMISVASQKRTDGRKQKIMFFSMEMTTDAEFNPRVLSVMSGLTVDECTAPGSIKDAARRKRYIDTLGKFSEFDLLVDERSQMTPSYVKNKVLQHKPDLVIIDYLQMMDGDGFYNGNRHREMADVIAKLKTIAKTSAESDDDKCAMMVLAQLNNEGVRASRQNNEPPTPQDIKESGDISMYCGHIVMLWQPQALADEGMIACIVRKNRFSPDEYNGKWRAAPVLYRKLTGGRLEPLPATELKALLDSKKEA